MLERAVARRNESYQILEEMIVNPFYSFGKFVAGNFAIPTYFRHQGETNIVAEFPQFLQTMAGFISYSANSMNLAMIVSGENNYPDSLAVPSSIWFVTNIASAVYEWYKCARNKINERKTSIHSSFSDEEI